MSSSVKLQSATKLLREQNNQHPSPHPHHSKLGSLLLSTGSVTAAQHCLVGVGKGKLPISLLK